MMMGYYNHAIVIVYAIAAASIILFGTFGTYILGQQPGNFNIKINSLVTAFYFTMTTLSTVGFGDIVPTSTIARLFVVALIFTGLGVFVSAITLISGDIIESRMEKISGKIAGLERRHLNGHIVLIGYDITNAIIAKKLKGTKSKFIIITSDKTIADKLREMKYKAYVADATSEEDMKNFNLGKARKIIIDLRDSSRTVYAAMVAKALGNASNIVVVAPTIELEGRLKDIKIKKIVNPAWLAAEGILNEL